MIEPSQEDLSVAKKSVEKHFSVVGLQEDMGSFYEVLEFTHPRYFEGAGAMYQAGKTRDNPLV